MTVSFDQIPSNTSNPVVDFRHPEFLVLAPNQLTSEALSMYIAMNRFKVTKETGEIFEQLWKTRESHLDELPGFVAFHLLKGPEREDHILYSSHTVWQSFADFENWTKSEQFRKSHANAGSSAIRPLYLGHPEFEGFHVLQEMLASPKTEAA